LAGEDLVPADFSGRAIAFFAAGLTARPCADLAGAAFLPGAARTGALLAGFLFAAAGFFVIVTFFLAAALARLAGAGLRAAGFAVGLACGFFAGVFAVFLAAGFFTGSPRNGAATLSRKARREGAANFGRGGL
jgi:uncharacterized membrane protein required for colicin V production